MSKNLGMVVTNEGKGHLGYTNLFNINIKPEDSDVLKVVGRLAFSPDEKYGTHGGMLELTGSGCNIAQANWGIWYGLYIALKKTDMRLTRVDIAWDLKNNIGYNFMQHNNITVPTICKKGKLEGTFTADRAPKPSTFGQAGDWSDMTFSQLSVDDYDPTKHCPKGLTGYFGTRASSNYWRVYEKGKEQLGNAEDAAIGSIGEVDLSWIRIEREITRKNKEIIALEMMLDSDSYFVRGFSKLEELFNLWVDYNSGAPVSPAPYESFQAKVKSSITKKVFWGKRAYGSLIATLKAEGMKAEQIVDLLARKTGVKGHVNGHLDIGELIGRAALFPS
jgi:DNA relaxase NicK